MQEVATVVQEILTLLSYSLGFKVMINLFMRHAAISKRSELWSLQISKAETSRSFN
jgi:hypothetical protein